MSYKKEADFTRSLSAKFKKAGIDYTRIECHNNPGIPDMFVQGCGLDTWIELKNDKGTMFRDCVKVDWRPGQVTWMFKYFMFHKNRMCLTIVSFVDGVAIIKMNETYTGHVVCLNDTANCMCFTLDEWKKLDLLHVLRDLSDKFIYNAHVSIRDNMLAFAVEQFGPKIMELDWDPQIIWQSACDQLEGYNNNAFNPIVDRKTDKVTWDRLQFFVKQELREVYKAGL